MPPPTVFHPRYQKLFLNFHHLGPIPGPSQTSFFLWTRSRLSKYMYPNFGLIFFPSKKTIPSSPVHPRYHIIGGMWILFNQLWPQQLHLGFYFTVPTQSHICATTQVMGTTWYNYQYRLILHNPFSTSQCFDLGSIWCWHTISTWWPIHVWVNTNLYKFINDTYVGKMCHSFVFFWNLRTHTVTERKTWHGSMFS